MRALDMQETRKAHRVNISNTKQRYDIFSIHQKSISAKVSAQP